MAAEPADELNDTQRKNKVFVCEQFTIIALVLVAFLVAIIFFAVKSAFPGLSPR